MSSRGHFPFFQLPGELRELIYLKVLSPLENQRDIGDGYTGYKYDLKLLRVNQQMYYEARRTLRVNNVFVSIATPWPEAQQHVQMQGYVPMILVGDKAKKFKHYHLGVTIDAPGHKRPDEEMQRFVVLLGDLKRFCEMWYYSDLGLPGLNAHLRLTLTIQDPYSLSFDPRPVPKPLQRRLLEPFGLVRNLREVVVKGEHYQSIEKSMREAMAVPYVPPKDCLEKATRLMEEGVEASANKRYEEAVNLYEQAFRAVHIVCEGRRRSVWADAFFQTEIREGTYRDQYGHIVRLMLRVQLVAHMISAYLGLENYTEARYWGERSINLMREAMGGDEEPIPEFVAAKDMGYIYYHTGQACKAQEDYNAAKRYLRIALSYLPGESDRIENEISACSAPRSESV